MVYTIQLFDVDGTLTYNYIDVKKPPENYDNFSFWHLLSTYFARNLTDFNRAIKAWEESMQNETDVDGSSYTMQAKTVATYLKKDTDAKKMYQYAKSITHDFIVAGAIQITALDYINRCLQKGIYCVFTTGSYLDGLRGFVAALIEANLLQASPHLLLNGSEVLWQQHKLQHANVGKFKVQKLQQTLTDKKLTPYRITAAFGDDPYVNDKAILKLAPKNRAFVIESKKNATEKFPPTYIRASWDEIIKQKENINLLLK